MLHVNSYDDVSTALSLSLSLTHTRIRTRVAGLHPRPALFFIQMDTDQMMRRLALWAVAVLAGYSSHPVVLTGVEAATSLPFFIPNSVNTFDIELNGDPTQIQRVDFTLTSAIPEGQIAIGNADVALDAADPSFRYFLDEVGRHPRGVLRGFAMGCLAGDPVRYNLSVAAGENGNAFAAPVPNGGSRHLLWSPRAAIAEAFASAVGLPGGLDQAFKELDGLEKNAKHMQSDIQTIQAQVMSTTQTLNKFKSEQGKLNNDIIRVEDALSGFTQQQLIFNSNIQQQVNIGRDQLVITQGNVDHLGQGLAMLSQNVDDRFAQEHAAIVDLSVQTSTALNSAQALQTQQIKDVTGYLVAELNSRFFALYNFTVASNTRIQGHVRLINNDVQQSLEQINVLGQLFWLYTNKQQLRRIISTKFWSDKTRIDSGPSKLLVSAGGIAPEAGGLQTTDLKSLFEGFYFNYVGSQSGVHGLYPEIRSVRVNIWANADESLDTAQGMIDTEWFIRRFGPGNCTRAFVGFDPITPSIELNEADAFKNFTACAFYIEVTTTTCAAANTTFRWRTADPTKSPAGQPNEIQSAFCNTQDVGIVTSATRVFRSFPEYKSWFEGSLCDVLNWSGSVNEYMITDVAQVPATRAFWVQNRGQCYGSIQDQNLYDPKTIFAFQWMLINEAVTPFIATVRTSELKKYGRLPNGIEYDYSPMQFSAVTFDEFQNAIFDGGADPLDCISLSWAVVTTDTVPMYAIVPKTNDFVSHEIVVTSYTSNAGFVRTYINDTITQEVEFTSELASLVPSGMLFLGDPFTDSLLYDIPQRIMETTNQVDAATNTFGALLAPPGTTTTPTFEEYQAMKGPRFQNAGGALNPFTFTFPKALDSTGSPYCVVTGGFPQNGSVTLDSQAFSQNPIPNGLLCTLLKFFRIETLFRDGQQEFHLNPRQWVEHASLFGYTGRVVAKGQSFCPDPSIVSRGDDGLEIQLKGQQGIATTVKYQVTTNIIGEASTCTLSGTVEMPALPGVAIVKLPSCTGITVNFFRSVVDPADFTLKDVDCLTPITPATVVQTIAAYSGIPLDVARNITVEQDRTTIGIQNLGKIVQGLIALVASRVFSDAEISAQIDPISLPVFGDPQVFLINSTGFVLGEGVSEQLNALRDRIRLDTVNGSIILDLARNLSLANANVIQIQREIQANITQFLADAHAQAEVVAAIPDALELIHNISTYIDIDEIRDNHNGNIFEWIAAGIAGIGQGAADLFKAGASSLSDALSGVLAVPAMQAILIYAALINAGVSLGIVAIYHFAIAKKGFATQMMGYTQIPQQQQFQALAPRPTQNNSQVQDA